LPTKTGTQTDDWKLYEAGKTYNNQLKPNYYNTVDANIAFYEGDQWRNLKADNMPKPVFNVIKRVINFQVASITNNKTKLHFEPILNADDSNDEEFSPADFANQEVATLFDKFKMDFKIKDSLFDAAITGDACAHFYWDPDKQPFGVQSDIKGEICMEMVDGTNVFFGNANNPNVEAQPYIIISGRDMVKNLQDEAEKYRQGGDPNAIQSDKDYFWQAGDSAKFEVEADDNGKALYIIIYRKDKKTGTVKVSKSVRNAYIYKDIDTGLSRYPIAWYNWEKQKNRYHGRALATGLLPNQIFINRMFAMVMYHLMMTAFPKAVYNADIIPTWDNSIGSAIPVSGMGPEAPIKNIAGYLEPGNMSGQIIQCIEMAMQYTKEMLGINDTALGNIAPRNTSAIIAVQKAMAIPLQLPKMNMYEWLEDIGYILFDFMGTYYGTRPVVMEVQEQKQVVNFDFSQFKTLGLKVRADVGESSYWSELSSITTLDNLLENGKIEFIDYLERIPDEYIPQKQELIAKLKDQMQQQDMMQQAQSSDPNAIISQLTPQEQQAFYSASPQQQQAVIQQLSQHLQQQQAPPPMG